MDGDDDLFDDLYDGEANDNTVATPPQPSAAPTVAKIEEQPQAPAPVINPAPSNDVHASYNDNVHEETASKPFDPSAEDTQAYDTLSYEDKRNRPVQLKDDGKMFIGGLNWETTDQSLKDYFSQFGEVTECTVMRDGATGRSRGFGFLTFRDPKVVNVVMVKEHILDGKLIDPKRAIPRDEQEKTSKIFVGGVSQEATEKDFKEYFEQFGRVLDATLMMDKDTGRPRGFGFVTFDNDAAVDNTLASELVILGKPIEVKRAQPRNNVRDEDDSGSGGRGGRFGGRGGRGGYQNNFGGDSHTQQSTQGQQNMTPAQMATMWMNMQNLMRMAQQNAMQNNPAMMQQMMMMNQAQGNPQAMQQMMQMYNNGGYPGGMSPSNSPMNGSAGANRGNMSPQQGDQSSGDQQSFDRQQIRLQNQNFNQGGAWEGMYDDVPAPVSNRGGRGGYRGGRGGGGGGPVNAPAGAPTGPKNAGRPGANYRGGGRGGRGNWAPYPQNRGGG